MRKRLNARLILLIILVIGVSYGRVAIRAEDEHSEPDVNFVQLMSLGATDRWLATVDYHDGSYSHVHIEGTMSEPVLESVTAEVLNTVTSGGRIVQQDILLGFEYSFGYGLDLYEEYEVDEEVTETVTAYELLEFRQGLRFPIRVTLDYSEPMIQGGSYPLFATLTPLDWPSFDEFVFKFEVIGQPMFDFSQSFVTPLGAGNSWSPFEIGPYYFITIPLILVNLELGLSIAPQVFSDRIMAEIGVTGDATLQGSNTLTWSAPNQGLQFNVLACDISSLDYASILIDQFKFYLNRVLVDVNLVTLWNWIWGGSSRYDFKLFTLDVSNWIPTLVFGTHPLSPATGVKVNVPVIALAPITIESCDPAGVKKDEFDISEDIRVKGGGYASSTTYDLYIVDDVTWTNGMAIPPRVPGTWSTVTSDVGGNIPPALVWGLPLVPGNYDIVVDVNGNGVYDKGADALDDGDIHVTAGFFVIPELPFGTISGVATCFVAFGVVFVFRRARTTA